MGVRIFFDEYNNRGDVNYRAKLINFMLIQCSYEYVSLHKSFVKFHHDYHLSAFQSIVSRNILIVFRINFKKSIWEVYVQCMGTDLSFKPPSVTICPIIEH